MTIMRVKYSTIGPITPSAFGMAVCDTLSSGVRVVIHAGPEPNLFPATYKRLADNVKGQHGGSACDEYRAASCFRDDRQALACVTIAITSLPAQGAFIDPHNPRGLVTEACPIKVGTWNSTYRIYANQHFHKLCFQRRLTDKPLAVTYIIIKEILRYISP